MLYWNSMLIMISCFLLPRGLQTCIWIKQILALAGDTVGFCCGSGEEHFTLTMPLSPGCINMLW